MSNLLAAATSDLKQNGNSKSGGRTIQLHMDGSGNGIETTAFMDKPGGGGKNISDRCKETLRYRISDDF
jgi:hypothetical protein